MRDKEVIFMIFAMIEKVDDDGYLIRYRDLQFNDKVRFFETLEQVYMHLKQTWEPRVE
jgi:hypothetical protein